MNSRMLYIGKKVLGRCSLIVFLFLSVITFFNACKPAVDSNANRTDYIRILDIGSVLNLQLQYVAVQTPPLRMIWCKDGNLAIVSTISLTLKDTSRICMQLTKTSSTGQVLWTHIYQDSAANLVANDVTLSTDGGFYIAATRLIQTDEQAVVLRTNENGDSLWLKQYDTNLPHHSECVSSLITSTTDGNYLLCGTYYDPIPVGFTIHKLGALLLLINANGDTLSNIPVTLAVNNFSFSSNAIINRNGEFLMVGSNPIGSTSEPLFYKIQTNSTAQLSSQTWSPSNVVTIHSVASDNSNNFILFGDSTVKQPPVQYAVIYSVPDDGTYLPNWEQKFRSGDHASFTSGIHTFDGGYVAAGYSVTRSDTSVFIAKIDGAGNALWSKTFPGLGDQATTILQASDGTYIVAGVTTSFGGRGGTNQAFIMRLNANGDYVN